MPPTSSWWPNTCANPITRVPWKIGTVVQIHLFAGSRRGRIVDIVQSTGSVGGDDMERSYGEVQGILQSVRVTA
mgnify:CR=1 FL=1